MTRNNRIAVIVAAIVVIAVGAVVAASSGGSGKAKTSGHAYVYIVDGKPRGGVQLLVYNKGDQVTFTVVSDVADEVHVHGYDFKKEVAKGGTVTFSFKATDQGDHVVELESRSEQIANLRVQ